MNDNEYGYTNPQYPQEQKPPKKTGKTLGYIAIFLCIALVFGVAGYAIGNNRNQQQLAAQDEQVRVNEGDAAPRETFSFDDSTFVNSESISTSVTEIANNNLDAVVLVSSMIPVANYGYGFNDGFGFFPFGEGQQQQQYQEVRGSGFFISEDGYIVTNNHVVEGAETVSVTLNNEQSLEAIVVGTDPRTDLAVLKIQGSGYTYSKLGVSSTLKIGEPCVAIGNPLGTLTGTVTSGVISALERTIVLENTEMTLLQHDAAINEGNSGGPLYNSKGEVIGINNAKTADFGVEGLGFAIPVDIAKPVIEDLINIGYVAGRPFIGITIQEISDNQAKYYDVVAGVGVVEVSKGSPAEKAGVQSGDIITATNGTQTLTLDALNEVKESLRIGDTMTLTVWRNGLTLTLDVVLGEEVPQTAAPTSYSSSSSSAENAA